MNSTSFEMPLPTYVPSDYIQLVYLVFVFFYGTPLNVTIFVKLLRLYKTTKCRLTLLSLNLTVSNLLILIFFVFVKLCWIITYKWTAGLIWCKFLQFAKSLSVILSSNFIVCIGLDRLLSLLYPIRIKSDVNLRCVQTLLVAWLLALICSAPQLYVWTVFDVAPNWSQCTDIWTIWDNLNQTTPLTPVSKKAYQALNLMFIFWLPLLAIIIFYAIILRTVYKNLNDIKRAKMLRNNRRLSWDVLRKNDDSDRTQSGNIQHRPLVQNLHQKRIKRTKYRTLKITVIIVGAYVFFWLPYNVLALWGLLDPVSYQVIEDYLYFFYGLIAVNAVVNPLIYYRLSYQNYSS